MIALLFHFVSLSFLGLLFVSFLLPCTPFHFPSPFSFSRTQCENLQAEIELLKEEKKEIMIDLDIIRDEIKESGQLASWNCLLPKRSAVILLFIHTVNRKIFVIRVFLSCVKLQKLISQNILVLSILLLSMLLDALSLAVWS